jgi:hypothetical protein
MIETRGHICSTGTIPQSWFHFNLHRLTSLLALVLLLGVMPAWADGPDDDYLKIYGVIQQGDELNTAGKPDLAKAKYVQAMTSLSSFKTNYPYWNKQLVALRLNYLTQKITALSEKPRLAATDTPTSDSGAPSGTKTAATASAAQIKLLDPGAEPRKVLRLHPKAGDKQTLEMTLKMSVETKMGEMSTPAMKLPEIKMSMETTIKDVAENGDITYELVMNDVGIGDESGAAPQVAEALKAAFGGIKGQSGTGTTSSRGISKGFEFKAPSDANPQTRQFVDQMKEFSADLAISLPEEAVGPGAKWQVKMPVKAQGMTINQDSTYEVVSLEGDTLTTKGNVAQEAANQKIQSPAMPGIKLDLTKMTGKGTGERIYDLAKLLPTTGKGQVHSETAMSMNMGGQKQAMNVKTDIEIRFAAK